MKYRAAGVPLAIGSDSQVRIDPFEEARELETGSRRERSSAPGCSPARGPVAELCRNGSAASGCRRSGGHAQVEIDLDHPDLRGVAPGDLPLALVTCASAGVVAAPR